MNEPRTDGIPIPGINNEYLETLPVYNPWVLYPAMCVVLKPAHGGDWTPPQHPKRFVQRHHVSPNADGTEVIVDRNGVMRYVKARDMDILWIRLPLSDPRVESWVRGLYAHMMHCYRDPKAEEGYPDKGRVQWPLDDHFWFVAEAELLLHDDIRFKDEWRNGELDRLEKVKAEFVKKWKAIAVPENHIAHRAICKYYPDAPTRRDLCHGIDIPVWEGIPSTLGTYHRVNGQWVLTPKKIEGKECQN